MAWPETQSPERNTVRHDSRGDVAKNRRCRSRRQAGFLIECRDGHAFSHAAQKFLSNVTQNMIRTYGNEPYRAAVIHGGPGAMGSVACIARELSKVVGVVEPIQSRYSLSELTDELHEQIKSVFNEPLTLIGHSWGAWLAILFAVNHPKFAKQIVLVGCPPFEERFAPQIMERRLARLSPDDAALFQSLLSELSGEGRSDQNVAMKQLEHLVEKSDNVDTFDIETDKTDLFPADGTMYSAVWSEAAEMRRDGRLMECLRKITIPVFVIHGDSDPHPLEGVVGPLRKCRADFTCHVLENCGHSPFRERNAHEEFYRMIETILQNNQIAHT